MNLTLNLKIFQGILSHLHQNHKHDIEDVFGFLEKKIAVGKNLFTSLCSSRKYEFVILQCYRQSYIIYAHICNNGLSQKIFVEPDIIFFVSLH